MSSGVVSAGVEINLASVVLPHVVTAVEGAPRRQLWQDLEHEMI